jgi:hypothetical protein
MRRVQNAKRIDRCDSETGPRVELRDRAIERASNPTRRHKAEQVCSSKKGSKRNQTPKEEEQIREEADEEERDQTPATERMRKFVPPPGSFVSCMRRQES